MRPSSSMLVSAVACPCQVPLLVVLLVGTAVSSLIADNLLLFFAAFGQLFAGSPGAWARGRVTARYHLLLRPAVSVYGLLQAQGRLEAARRRGMPEDASDESDDTARLEEHALA